MSTALYRRYRPETFDQVIGQEHVTDPLKAAIERGRINHAYLFSGPRGCGKTTSARILARCLNCEKGPTPVPCGECPSCTDLANGGPGSLDVVEIDAASHNGVDDARDLRERAIYAPARDRFKVFILDEAHMVTSQGFNALLKIVEEPPPHIKFIFATTEPEKVIGTIRSRTHHYPFRLVPPEVLGNYLDELCRREDVQVAKGVLPLVVRAGGGSVRDTLSVLDQLIAGSGPNGVDYSTAVALLGYTPDSLLSDIVDAFSAGDGGGVYRAVERVVESGQDPRRFVEDLLERMRDLIVIHAAPEAAHAFLPAVPPDRLERLALQARGFGQAELSRAADLLNQGLTEMSGATSPRLQLELICARILLPAAGRNREAVLSRVERMERRIGMSATGTVANMPAPVQTETPAQTGAAPGSQTQGGQSAAPVSSAVSNSQPPAENQARGDSASASDRGPAAGVAPVADDFDELTAIAAAAESMLQEPPRAAPVERTAAPEPQRPAPRDRQERTPSAESRQPENSAQQQQQQPRSQSPRSPQPQAGRDANRRQPVQEPQQTVSTGPSQQGTDRAPAAGVDRGPGPAGVESGADGIGGEIEAIRRAWPSILAAVEKRSRLTRAIIAANAIPQSFANGVVYLGFNNAGSVQGFQQRDHAAKLALAINDVLGIQARIDIGDVGRIAGSSDQSDFGQGDFGQGSHGQGSHGQGSNASSSDGSGPASGGFSGGRGPEAGHRRPSPQEVAAVVGTREVDKPQVDHEKFWETNDSPQGPWSTDDEEGEPAADNRSSPVPAQSSGSSGVPASSAPEADDASKDSHVTGVPDAPSASGALTDTEPRVSHESVVEPIDDSAIVIPDLSDSDFDSPLSDVGPATTAPPSAHSFHNEEPSSQHDERPNDGPPSDEHPNDDAPMEYVQPRWDEPTWHDAPGNGSDLTGAGTSANAGDFTSAGAGAVEVGALVVPPPEDDDLDFLGAYADPDVDFTAGTGSSGTSGNSAPAEPSSTQATGSQPAGSRSSGVQPTGSGKPFQSRFAAIAQRQGLEAPPSSVAPAVNEYAPNGNHSFGGDRQAPASQGGADEDEYDPETDLDVSEAPQIGVAVIARILGGEIIDEREI